MAGEMFGLGLASAAANTGLTFLSRDHSFRLNERSANNAMQRQKMLYHDLYSPAAQARQIKDAGLSLGLMYAKGNVGGSGASAPMAAPANAQMLNVLDLANLRMLDAQTEKTKAEAKNVEATTEQTKATTTKTNQEIINLLTENKLNESKLAYQELVNKLTSYEERFKAETLQTDIEQRKVELAKLVEDYRAAMANADNAEIQAQIADSTAAAKVKQELQAVVLNDLEIQNKKLNLKLTQEQINKVKEEIVEKRLNNAWIDIRNEEDLNKLRHDIQMDLIDLDIKDRDQNYRMAKGIIDSFISIVKPWNK